MASTRGSCRTQSGAQPLADNGLYPKLVPPRVRQWLPIAQGVCQSLTRRPSRSRFSVRGPGRAPWLAAAGLFLLASECSPSLSAPAAPETDPIPVGSRLELFTERDLIDRLSGSAERRVVLPSAGPIVMEHDAPWEGNACGYHTVFRDGARFRMYYRGWHVASGGGTNTHEPFLCYAESQDGSRWVKPALGIFEFAGSASNNIVWRGQGAENMVPFKDANPACQPEQAYKAVGGLKREGGLFAFCSADGLRWFLMQKAPILTGAAFDSQNLVFWDQVRGEYRCYFRDLTNGWRDVKTCTAPDFTHWSEPAWLNYPGAAKQHLYTSQVQPYFRAPHLFIAFPTILVSGRGGLTEPRFMSSRDGITFQRWEDALIWPGQNRDRWGNRSNYIWLGLVETASDLPGAPHELSVYSGERYLTSQPARLRRYVFGMDRFVSVHADPAGGECLTRPIIFEGRTLLLNYSTAAAGGLRVELQTAAGTPIKGFTLDDCPVMYGDEIEGSVKWNDADDLGALAGQPVRLRFALKAADVFAFRCR